MSREKAGVGAIGSTRFSVELHRERLDDRRAERDIGDRRKRPIVARRDHAGPQGMTRPDGAGRRSDPPKKVAASWNQPDGQTLRARLEVSPSCRLSGGTRSVAAEKTIGRERRGLQ